MTGNERLIPDPLHAAGDLYSLQIPASEESSFPYTFQVLRDRHFCQLFAEPECAVSDHLHALRDLYGGQCFVLIKHLVPDRCHALRDHHLPSGTIVVTEHAVDDHEPVAVSEAGAIFERILRGALAVRYFYTLEVIAVAERLFSYARHAVRDHQLRQGLTAVKGSIPYFRYTVRNDDLFQVPAMLKCVVPYPLQVSGKGHALKAPAFMKSILADLRHAVRDDNVIYPITPLKGALSDPRDTV